MVKYRSNTELMFRHQERGAAVFIVVLTVTLLTGIGLFAVRTASLVDMAAGFNREAVQTGYLAQYGTFTAAAEFGRSPRTYYNYMTDNKDKSAPSYDPNKRCRSNANPVTKTIDPSADCYRLGRAELDGRAFTALLDATSLGLAATTEGDVDVEFTDPILTVGPPGTSLSSDEDKYLRVTITTFAEVRPAGAGAACANSGAAVVDMQTVRSNVVVPL